MDKNTMNRTEATPSPKRVIEGLRDTGYTFYTAICDIVDNSITAKATKIIIRIDLEDRTIEPKITIADNGTGMSPTKIVEAMTYGSPATAADDKLGKFGLGLKTASTAFCKDLIVVSRAEGEQIAAAEWDLDYIASVNKWSLLLPQPTSEEIEYLEEAAGPEGTGTLVKWSKVDRLLGHEYSQRSAASKRLNAMIGSLRFYMSMTYQRYLDPAFSEYPTLEIIINNQPVKPWDPFGTKYSSTQNMQSSGNDGVVPVELPDGTYASFVLKGYILPRKDELSAEEDDEAHISNDMQGLYIYREGRLIHYGDWLGIYSKEPHGSLLRVDLSFGKELDSLFNVDIKKSRILLNTSLYDYIEKHINPWRREADNRYRTGQTSKRSANAQSAHEVAANEIAKKSPAIEKTEVLATNGEKGVATIKNANGVFERKIVIHERDEGFGRVIPVKSIDDGLLWNPTIVDGALAVEINEGHPFYEKVYGPILKNGPVVQGIDYLLWALASAENESYADGAKEFCDDFKFMASRKLRKLVSDLPDVSDDE